MHTVEVNQINDLLNKLGSGYRVSTGDPYQFFLVAFMAAIPGYIDREIEKKIIGIQEITSDNDASSIHLTINGDL